MRGGTLILAAVAAMAAAAPVRAQSGGSCGAAPAGSSAEAALDRALAAAGLDRAAGRVLYLEAMDAEAQLHQSDRTYAPFFNAYYRRRVWVDPATATQRAAATIYYPGTTAEMPGDWITTDRAAFMTRDTAVLPVPQGYPYASQRRLLDAATVLREWRDAGGARVAGRCEYRDFPRLVLEREAAGRAERLYLDPESGLPVALARQEPHYLWGDVGVEYVYSNWKTFDGALVPMTSYRMMDGTAEITRTVTAARWTPADSTPRLALPASPDMRAAAGGASPGAPDTVRVAEDAFLLVERAYTTAVVLARDTVFVLDATLGEERARRDAEWVEKLFPGDHPLVVVVTDLAWPHIAGVRHWVARGATVVSHRASRDFLERVVERRWTLEPDLLEENRARVRFRFRAVEDQASLAGGAIRLAAIDGIGSEGALMAFVPESGFLWAGDFVQNTKAPTAYALEVRAAARRAGFVPRTVAAMHIPLTEWAAMEAVLVPAAAAGPGGE